MYVNVEFRGKTGLSKTETSATRQSIKSAQIWRFFSYQDTPQKIKKIPLNVGFPRFFRLGKDQSAVRYSQRERQSNFRWIGDSWREQQKKMPSGV